ncbi:MAG TPA: DUF4286 family protein [Gammaproteobacteria bacterium]|nr:DUF4286 family protein [Gammaproteobacteria bacterium]
MTTPLVYEVTLDISADKAPEFDAWLRLHVRDMLALPGFRDARVLTPEAGDAAPSAVRRVVQYTLAGRVELDRYLAEQAPRMRAEGVKRFGDKLKTSRRVLDLEPSTAPLSLPGLALAPEGPRCRNCGTPLLSKFCMECGQKNHTYVAPLWNVLHDFAAIHFGFDTKFFHSIFPLLFRPGFLTREYCAGHEERYIKPFRLYLFSSILFFFLAAFMWTSPADTLDQGLSGAKRLTAAAQLSPEKKVEKRAEMQKALSAIAAAPGDSAEKQYAAKLVQDELAALDASSATTVKAVATAATPAPAPGGPGAGFYVNANPAGNSDLVHVDVKPGKGSTKLSEDNPFYRTMMYVKDHQDEFKKKLWDNLPKMMFMLMPLIALFLKLFYLGSGRYLTEHFVFTLHYHAMLFVVLLFVMLFDFGAKHLPWLAPLKDEAGTVAGWYMVVYLFLALRFFYQQSWFKTTLKFGLLFVTYFIAFGLTMAVVVVLTAAELNPTG